MRLTLAIVVAALLYSMVAADVVARGTADAIIPLYNRIAAAIESAR